VPGTIEGFLPFSDTQPLFHIGSAPDISYLGNGTGPFASTSVVAAIDNISLYKNSQQRIAVKDTDEVVLVDAAGVERLNASSVGTSISSERGIDLDHFYIAATDIQMDFNSRRVFFVTGTSFRTWSPDRSTELKLEDGAGVKINDTYYLPTTDGTANQVVTTNGAGTSSWATPLGMTAVFGGNLTNSTDVYVYNGGQGSVCGPGSTARGNVFVVPIQCRVNVAAYDTQSGAFGTELGLYVNGGLVTQFALSGPRGVATNISSVLLDQNDVLAVGCVVGPFPDQSTVTLYMTQ